MKKLFLGYLFWVGTALAQFTSIPGTPLSGAVGGASALTTAGWVPYVTSAGVLGGEANLFWDATNDRLGVGTNTPGFSIQVGNNAGTAFQRLAGGPSANQVPVLSLFRSGVIDWTIATHSAGHFLISKDPTVGYSDATLLANARLMIHATTGNLLLNTTTDDGTNRLQVAGAIKAQGASSGFVIGRRDTGTSAWTLYSTAGDLAFYNNSTNYNNATFGTGGAFTIYNELPAIGSTSLIVRAGAGQSGNLTTWQNSAGSTIASVSSAGTIYSATRLFSAGDIVINQVGAVVFQNPNDGILTLTNNAGTAWDRINLGGNTSSFPALKRSAATLQVRLADDTAFAAIQASSYISSDGSAGVTGATCSSFKNGLCVAP